MKFLFTCVLIIIALYLILDQQGAIDWALHNINSGKAAATYRGN